MNENPGLEPEVPISVPMFDWRFKDVNWKSEKTQMDQALLMLEQIDAGIHEIDVFTSLLKKHGYNWEKVARLHEACASYLNVRISVLFHIHTVKPVYWEGDTNGPR